MSVASFSANVSQATRRGRLFGNIIFWMMMDIRRSAKGLYGRIVAFSVLSVCARLGAIGSFMVYVNAQLKAQPIVLAGVELPSDTGLWTLLIWGSAAFLLASATGLSTYLADVTSFRMSREAMRRVVDRAMVIIAAGQNRPLAMGDQFGLTKATRKALTGDALMYMRAMLVLGGVAIPLTTFVVAAAVLMKLNLQLTLILVPVLMIYVIPFYALNRAVATASRSYEECRQHRAGVLTRLLDFASQTQYPGVTRPVWTELYQADPSVRGSMDAFRGIILARRRVAFLQDGFFGVILLVILVAFGSFLLSEDFAWIPVLAYFVALRFAVTGMGGTAAVVTAVNRFAPQLNRLNEFLSLDMEAAAVGIDPEAKSWTFRTAGPGLDGSALSVKPQPGDFIACIDPCPTDSYRLIEFCQRLLGTSNQTKCNRLLGAMFYCGDVRSFPGLPIVQILTGEREPEATTIDQAQRVLERFGVLNEIKALPLGMQTILTPESTDGLSPLCRYALCLVPGVRSSRQYFVLDWKPLARMGSEARQVVFDNLSDRIVMLISKRTPVDLLSQASLVVVLDESTISGIGDTDWFNRVARDHHPDRRETVVAGVAGDGLSTIEDETLDDV